MSSAIALKFHLLMRRILLLAALLLSLSAAPSFSQTASDIAKSLANPPLTARQRALLQEMSQSAQLNANVAGFFGLSRLGILERSDEAQVCLAAQYIVFQDIVRSNLPAPATQFAQNNLKREDWCAPIVKTASNKSVAQILAVDGITTLFFVLSKDMENRLIAQNLVTASQLNAAKK
jgi:hypothetical protein